LILKYTADNTIGKNVDLISCFLWFMLYDFMVLRSNCCKIPAVQLGKCGAILQKGSGHLETSKASWKTSLKLLTYILLMRYGKLCRRGNFTKLTNITQQREQGKARRLNFETLKLYAEI